MAPDYHHLDLLNAIAGMALECLSIRHNNTTGAQTAGLPCAHACMHAVPCRQEIDMARPGAHVLAWSSMAPSLMNLPKLSQKVS